jgi:hypoxanthine phosphoribosyltransferase
MSIVSKPPTIDYSEFDFHDDVGKIITNVRNTGLRHDYVVALSRGGLIPGVVISHSLGIPMIAVNWSKTNKEINQDLWEIVSGGRKRLLVVDDMVDTGELLEELFVSWGEWAAFDETQIDTSTIDVAVLINNTDVEKLYVNDTGMITTTFWGRALSRKVTPDWITYWWEKQR